MSVVINILYYASPLSSAVSIFYCDYRPLETVLIVLPSLSLFSKIGEEQSPEDAEDGPPELLVSAIRGRRGGSNYNCFII